MNDKILVSRWPSQWSLMGPPKMVMDVDAAAEALSHSAFMRQWCANKIKEHIMTIHMLRKRSLLEDIQESETLAELDAIVRTMDEYREDPDALAAASAKRLTFTPAVVSSTEQLLMKLLEMSQQLEALRSVKSEPRPTTPLARTGGKRYEIISTDVTWCNTPQVQVIAEVLSVMVEATGLTLFAEDDILFNLEQNVQSLKTRQPVRKVWDFYKGRMCDAGMIKVG